MQEHAGPGSDRLSTSEPRSRAFVLRRSASISHSSSNFFPKCKAIRFQFGVRLMILITAVSVSFTQDSTMSPSCTITVVGASLRPDKCDWHVVLEHQQLPLWLGSCSCAVADKRHDHRRPTAREKGEHRSVGSSRADRYLTGKTPSSGKKHSLSKSEVSFQRKSRCRPSGIVHTVRT